MAFLLANWTTDRRETRIAGGLDHRRLDDHRLISSMFDISLLTDQAAAAVARQQVGMHVNRLVGMAFNVYNIFTLTVEEQICDPPPPNEA